MPQLYQSPIERLVALGKAVPVPETEVKLVAHMKRTYVPSMEAYVRSQGQHAEDIRNIPLADE